MLNEKEALLEKLKELEAHGRFVISELTPGYARSRVQRMVRLCRSLRAKFQDESMSVVDLCLHPRRRLVADPPEG